MNGTKRNTLKTKDHNSVMNGTHVYIREGEEEDREEKERGGGGYIYIWLYIYGYNDQPRL